MRGGLFASQFTPEAHVLKLRCHGITHRLAIAVQLTQHCPLCRLHMRRDNGLDVSIARPLTSILTKMTMKSAPTCSSTTNLFQFCLMRRGVMSVRLRSMWFLGAVLFALTITAAEIEIVGPMKAGLAEAKLAAVDQFMERQVTDKKIAGGSVLISHQGKIGFFHTYGQRDLEGKKPMEQDTIVRLYSMTKAITTAAALNLVDAGKIGLDDPVSKYIPSFANLKVATPEGLRAPARAMTVRDLMLHTSGLSYGDGPDALKEAFARLKPLESANLEEMAEKLSQIPLAFDPGTSWRYSVSIDILGRVIEVASGQNLDVFLRKTIFEPLQMSDASFNVPPEKLARFAANYSRSADGLKLIDAPANSRYGKPVTFFSGGGGLVGTANDYLRFLTMIQNAGELDGKRILRPGTVKLMITNQLPEKAFPIRFGDQMRHGTGFGLGFSVRTENTKWDPAGHLGEYGWGGAASTHYWCSPADKLIVITLEQTMPYQWDTEFGVKQLIYDSIVAPK
ncbi:MAG: beta-lactamase [Planctomycetaceae bacterium]|nr:beta-lactamase [Planctomycetaceae bacterium]